MPDWSRFHVHTLVLTPTLGTTLPDRGRQHTHINSKSWDMHIYAQQQAHPQEEGAGR